MTPRGQMERTVPAYFKPESVERRFNVFQRTADALGCYQCKYQYIMIDIKKNDKDFFCLFAESLRICIFQCIFHI